MNTGVENTRTDGPIVINRIIEKALPSVNMYCKTFVGVIHWFWDRAWSDRNKANVVAFREWIDILYVTSGLGRPMKLPAVTPRCNRVSKRNYAVV